MQEEGGQLQPDGAHPGLGGHGVAAAGSLPPAGGYTSYLLITITWEEGLEM